jgi:hypothetical protein
MSDDESGSEEKSTNRRRTGGSGWLATMGGLVGVQPDGDCLQTPDRLREQLGLENNWMEAEAQGAETLVLYECQVHVLRYLRQRSTVHRPRPKLDP